jgi:DNA-binding NarL/FixJ family response regulator
MRRSRVLLADDHAPVAEQLRAVMEPEFDVIAVVGDGGALVSAAETLTPDVIVTDIAMPGRDGITAARDILRSNPSARIVFVTLHNDPALVRRGLATGALGYVLKLTAVDDLIPAIHAALRGHPYVSGTVHGSDP